LHYYDAAASARSSEPVVVTLNRTWRGKPVSEMAAESARRLQKRLKDADTPSAQAALLSVRGVSAANRNDWHEARQDFLRAYSLDPASAFSLNNLGYVSERDGDIETAHFFYSKAQRADDADARIGLATQPEAEGRHLDAVAGDSGQKVRGELDQYHASRQTESGDIELKRRDNTPAEAPATSPQQPAPSAQPHSSQPPAVSPQQALPSGAAPAPPQSSVPAPPPHSN
jgi:tetratricopeptide (TPR) repeat protein